MVEVILAIIAVELFFTMMILRRIAINHHGWASQNIVQMGSLVLKK
jgi:hypothetical protein